MRIRKCILTVLFLPLVAGCHKVSHVSEEVVVNLRQKGTDISSSMYGVFFEEINHAGDGGLYAELVQNRSFEEDEIPAWSDKNTDQQHGCWCYPGLRKEA